MRHQLLQEIQVEIEKEVEEEMRVAGVMNCPTLKWVAIVRKG